MARIKSNKYAGVYYNELEGSTKDKTYYITYKGADGKKVWESIGKHSGGVREPQCHTQRAQRINTIKNGQETNKAALRRIKSEALITVNDLFDYYIKNRQMKSEVSSGFRGTWNLHVKDKLGVCDARTLTAQDIMSERATWNVSESTKARIVGHIGASYRFSTVHNEAFKGISSPMDDYTALDKAFTSKEIRKSRRNIRSGYLSLDDIEKLREAVLDNPVAKMAVEVMLSTGARITGALSIRKRDIDVSNQTITLIDHKSGGDTYTGYISPRLKEILDIQLPLLKNKNDFIIGIGGERMPYRTISRHLKKVLDELFNDGLDERNSKERIVIHSLRHTFASQLAIKGAPIYTIQKLLNHSDITMTMRYAKLAPDSGRDAVLSLYE